METWSCYSCFVLYLHDTYFIDGPLLMIRFSFKPISIIDIEKEVQLINPKKASTRDSITPLLVIIYYLFV